MMRFRWIWGILAVVLLAACSSAPAPTVGVQERKNRAADYLKFGKQAFQELKNRAADYLKFGKQAFQETHYEQALAFYQIALDLNTAVDNEAGMAVAWNSVSTAQTALGQTAEARISLNQAETLAQLTGDKTLTLQVAVNQIQADVAAGDTTSAQKRLAALRPFPETEEGASLYNALGTLERNQDHLVEALAAFDKALALNDRLGLKQEMATNRFMKASVLGRQNNWKGAQAELKAALALDRLMENTMGIGQDWRALGTVALRLEAPQEAFDAYVRAERLFQTAGLTDQRRKTIEMLLPVATTLKLADDAAKYRAILDKLTQTRP